MLWALHESRKPAVHSVPRVNLNMEFFLLFFVIVFVCLLFFCTSYPFSSFIFVCALSMLWTVMCAANRSLLSSSPPGRLKGLARNSDRKCRQCPSPQRDTFCSRNRSLCFLRTRCLRAPAKALRFDLCLSMRGDRQLRFLWPKP